MLNYIIAQVSELAATATDLAVPTSSQEAINLIGSIGNAFQTGAWNIGISAIVLVLVWFFTTYIKPFIEQRDRDKIPLITAIVGTITATVIALGATPVDASWYVWVSNILVGGIITGGTAMGLWSLLFKYILPKPKDNKEGISDV